MRLSPPSRSHHFESAFTLIELLVTIGILAIVAGSVIVAYDDAGSTAGDDLTRQRMAAVREGLLRFRGDMGYFPGEGPFRATDLANPSAQPRIYPSNIDDLNSSDADALKAWADHRMNLWQLFQLPTHSPNPTVTSNWKWDPDVKRGWNGPYLGAGFHFRLDDEGTKVFRLMAVSDAFDRNLQDEDYLWYTEAGVPPEKNYLRKFGRPLMFERYPPNNVRATFTLVSMGPDGRYDGHPSEPPLHTGPRDDLRLEVGREGN